MYAGLTLCQKKISAFYRQSFDRWGRSERAPGGYQKNVIHDSVVDRDSFTREYRRLKEKYQCAASFAIDTDMT